MSWRSSFVIYRVFQDRSIQEIYETSDAQRAKYWIKYIAETADVLCKTPLSTTHTKTSERSEYWCHKEASGVSVTNYQSWIVETHAFWPDFEFPLQPLTTELVAR